MYKLKENIELKLNKTKASEDIGITRVYLTNILNHKRECSKVVAYCITKFLNSEAEIADYFERVS